MKREAQFTPAALGALLAFLATRQIFTGAGRVGQANPLAFDFEVPAAEETVDFQLSQRADHIVNDIYQWVQFNRAIINARDEPLADYRKYRRLHLLIGDSNMSPFANALKIGTTACILTLLEAGLLPNDLTLARCGPGDPGNLARSDPALDRGTGKRPDDRRARCAMAVARAGHAISRQRRMRKPTGCSRAGATRWMLCLTNPRRCSAGVDWISKKWLLDTFLASENLTWNDPWLQSLDLEYHNIDPARGLFFGLQPAKRIGEWNNLVRQKDAARTPPADTRASGRAQAVAALPEGKSPYVINWDSIACETHDFLVMGNPFKTYLAEVAQFMALRRGLDSGQPDGE